MSVSTMCALKVTWSTIAEQSRGSVNVCFHSENGAFDVQVEIAELVQTEQVNAPVAGQRPVQL